MKQFLLVTIMLFFTGCNNDITPQEMARKIQECKDNNLTYAPMRNVINYKITDIVCEPIK